MTKKLLLADDSVTIQRVIGIIFATEDYQLLTTDNGDEAYEMAVREMPDLVLADISMPGKDGFELCQNLKSDARFVNTSVMLLPGTFDHFDEERAQDVGADGWLSKPFESQALLDKVEQLLEAEPVRLTAAEPAVTEEPAAAPLAEEPSIAMVPPVIEPVADIDEIALEEPLVDETALGLEQADEVAVETPVEEESADDIWDAVSFDEEELEPAAETALDLDVDAPVADSTAEALGTEEMVEAAETFEVADDAPVAQPAAVEPEVEEAPIEFAAAAEDAEEDIFDVEEEQFEDLQMVEDELPDVGEDTPLELADEFVVETPASSESEAAPAVAAFATPEIESEFAVEEPPELSELAEEESIATADELLAEEPDEEILDLGESAEEVFEVSAPEPETVEGAAADVLELDEAEEVLELSDEGEELIEVIAQPEVEFEAEEEILDLAEEDILEEEPITEAADDFISADSHGMAGEEAEDDAFVIADEVDEEPAEMEFETEEVFAESAAPEPTFAETATAMDEELELGEEVIDEPDTAEDENFFFDEPAEEDERADSVDVAAVAAVAGAGLATGAVAAGLADTEPGEAPTAPVEQQLRELSEDELKAVVAKVAGPMIEKMAQEMLEQIAWEVVPDLAESMIRDEIRKLKQDAE